MSNVVQGSPEWFSARAGRVTASRVADIVAKTKSGPSASRANYMAQLIAERLTGETAESFSSAAMQHGTDTEPQARAAYQFEANTRVIEIGFVNHPTIGWTGASPDGLVGDDGLVEIKCPNTATHIDTLLGATVPSKYVTQIMWQLACTGRAWCDFVSFDPRLPESMRMFVKRVHCDPVRVAELEGEVITFLAELSAKEHELRKRYEPPVEMTEAERMLMAG